MNRKALHSITYGLYVIGSRKGDSINAQIANTVVQVCSEPPTISVCINRGNLTHDYISDSRVFSVSVLSQDTPLSFVGDFGFKSGRESAKLSGVSYKPGETGAPVVLDHALSYLEAKVTSQMETGSHTIFVGEVAAAEVVAEGEPMTYAYYQQVKRGTTPKAAPSYVEAESKGGASMAKYKCSVCGYIYDPEKGDPDSNIAPGTAFEDLPDDWSCPVCGAAKSDFEKLED